MENLKTIKKYVYVRNGKNKLYKKENKIINSK